MLLSMLLVLGCTPKKTLEHGGLEREYFLHVPDDLPDGAPLVFFLHGLNGNARLYSLVGMKKQADEHGFVLVIPQGTDDIKGRPHWNAQLKISETDDIGFLTALAGTLQQAHGLDPERTYTTGISNGGFMSYALVCQAPEVFHAAGSIIGTMSGQTWETCPDTPVPIFQVSGAEDDVVPLSGMPPGDGGWDGAPEMAGVIDRWVEVNGCTEAAAIDTGDPEVAGTRHTGCVGGAEVRYYEIAGMGHRLPRWAWDAELAAFLMGLR